MLITICMYENDLQGDDYGVSPGNSCERPKRFYGFPRRGRFFCLCIGYEGHE